jgi:hypothetical protein
MLFLILNKQFSIIEKKVYKIKLIFLIYFAIFFLSRGKIGLGKEKYIFSVQRKIKLKFSTRFGRKKEEK